MQKEEIKFLKCKFQNVTVKVITNRILENKN